MRARREHEVAVEVRPGRRPRSRCYRRCLCRAARGWRTAHGARVRRGEARRGARVAGATAPPRRASRGVASGGAVARRRSAGAIAGIARPKKKKTRHPQPSLRSSPARACASVLIEIRTGIRRVGFAGFRAAPEPAGDRARKKRGKRW